MRGSFASVARSDLWFARLNKQDAIIGFQGAYTLSTMHEQARPAPTASDEAKREWVEPLRVVQRKSGKRKRKSTDLAV